MTEQEVDRQALEKRVGDLEAELARRKETHQVLVDEKEKYRLLVEDADVASFMVDHEGAFTYVSPALATLTGRPRDELLGRSFHVFIHPDDVEMLVTAFLVTAAGELGPSEYRVIKRDGRISWIKSFSRPIYKNGLFQGLRGVIFDLTERKTREDEIRGQKEQLEQLMTALSEKEAKFRTIFESAPEGLFTLDYDRIIQCNSRASELFGLDAADIVGKTPYNLSPPFQENGEASQPLALARIEAALAGTPQFFEWRHQRADGSVFSAEISLSRFDFSGRTQVLAFVRDITPRKRADAALRESEEKYRTILDVSGDGYYEVDLEGTFTDVNQMFCRNIGYDQHDIVGRNFRDFVSSDMADRIYEVFNRVFVTGAPLAGLQPLILKKDQTTAFLEISVAAINDPRGRRTGFRGLSRDISERKRFEEAICRSEEKYRVLYDHAVTGMFRVELPTGKLQEINNAAVRMFGYADRDEMKASFDYQAIHADPAEKDRFLAQLREQGQVQGLVVPVLKKQGDVFFAELSAKIDQDKNCLEGSFIDVTERRRTQEALRESEEKYRGLFHGISDIIITHDLEGRLLEVNPAAAKTLGFKREEIIGRLISDFMPAENRRLFFEEYLTDMMAKERREGILKVLDKQGLKRDIEYRIILTRPDKGPPVITGVGRDVTEKLQAQRELRSMQEQLHQARKMQAVGALASGIAHDFNNILQAISGFTEVIQARGGQDDVNGHYLAEIKRAVGRASDLVNGLLTFSRKVKPELKPVDLNSAITQTLGILERTIPKMVSLETKLTAGAAPILGEEAQLQQILINLAANAKDAMPEGGRLIIETNPVVLDESHAQTHLGITPGHYLLLRVSDTGFGMDPETVSHIFDPFFTTKEIGKGTGLGLSTVYGIVKGHNAHINCYSEPGRGTVFHIYFPRSNEAPSAPPPEPEERNSFSPHGSETILVVDDEGPIMEIAQEYLEQYGYTVLTASNGEAALLVYADNRPAIDLVVLDLGMPGMGGLGCLRELRRIDPEVKVIIASGYAPLGHSGEIGRLGAGGFIEKPYKLKDMIKKIREVLDKAPVGSDAASA
ncbi:MAG: PAS domain S-box protein [Pseudomonadota bacterium]